MRKFFSLFISCLCSVLAVYSALPTDFHFRHYSLDDGLASNSISAIMQDSIGYIWIGTDNGLSRFDGTRFTTFSRKNPLYQGLKSSAIVSLCEIDSQTILLGTHTGIYFYHAHTDTFERPDLLAQDSTAIGGQVSYLTKDRTGAVWITTTDSDVFRFHPQTRKLTHYPLPENRGFTTFAYCDSRNNIWVTAGEGVYRLNQVNDRFERLIPNAYGMSLIEDEHRHLWIGTWTEGLWQVDAITGTVLQKHRITHQGKDITNIHSIAEYQPGILLFGSDAGLSVFDTRTGDHILHTEKRNRQAGALSGGFVYPLLKDREGGIWIGTYYDGINYLPPYSGQFRSCTPDQGAPCFSGRIINRFQENAEGDIWLSSDNSGLSLYSPATGCFKDFPGREALQTYNIHGLCIDGDELWIGSYGQVIRILHTRTGAIRTLPELRGADSNAYSIFRDSRGRIWIGTMSSIFCYDKDSGQQLFVQPITEGLVIDIREDSRGDIWCAASGQGIYRYQSQSQSWKHYGTAEGIRATTVTSLLIDKGNRIWAGTTEGLHRYDEQTDSFSYQPLPLPNEYINALLEGDDCLWITTMQGLAKYTLPDETVQLFTRSDGLSSNVFVMAAALKARNGELFVGTINGFTSFYPHRLKLNTRQPQVVITGLEIFNRKVETDPNGILPAPIDRIKEIHLSHKDNVITLQYASLSYCTPEKNQYAYKLEGFDKKWNYVGTQHSTTYTNLPAGTYTFRVKASNNDHVWSEQEATLKVVVHPPFYLTLPFKMVYLLLAIVALTLLFRYFYQKSEKKHAEEIGRLQAVKEKEVHEAKINFFTMIAHEIRTPVSLIIGPLEKIMQSPLNLPAQVRKDLEIIDRNSQRLLYLVNQLLDFRKVEQKEMRMEFMRQPLLPLMKAVCERFQPFSKQKNISLEVSYPDKSFQADLDKEAITKVISNLLTNATKYAKDRVLVTFAEQPAQETFSIEVTDNGQGMDAKELKKIFKPFYQGAENKPGTGIGLSIVKGIVEAHHGAIGVTSQPNNGSTFTITLPVRQQDVAEKRETSPILEDILPETVPQTTDKKRQETILAVDDNEDMLSFLKENFKDTYTLLTAMDGKEAIEVLKQQEVSLIISDWMMPEMDGPDLCRAVRANQLTSHIPFILLTAKTDTKAKTDGMNCGADAYIEKPFSLQYLEACVRNLLELRSQLKRKFSRMPDASIHTIAENKADSSFVEKMNQIIEENFDNPELSVEFLAEKLCISRSGLFAKIKGLADITPNEMIQLIRLKKAASLLLENKYRINEVSYMVGFNNPSYFSKCFQKQFGIKPGEFVATHARQAAGADDALNPAESSSAT